MSNILGVSEVERFNCVTACESNERFEYIHEELKFDYALWLENGSYILTFSDQTNFKMELVK